MKFSGHRLYRSGDGKSYLKPSNILEKARLTVSIRHKVLENLKKGRKEKPTAKYYTLQANAIMTRLTKKT